MGEMLLVSDGNYIWAHPAPGAAAVGPFVAILDDHGQLTSPERNASDPYGLPFNPAGCIGGRVHIVENPLFPPQNLWAAALDG